MRLTVASAAEHAVVSVYNALGRRVAVLHDGPLGEGAQALAFESAGLPAGLYVVHARLESAGGAVWRDVRRITVVR